MKWEVAIQSDTNSRVVLARDVDTEELWAYFVEAAEDLNWTYHLGTFEPDEKRALARLKDKLKVTPASNSYGPRVPGILITRMDCTPEAKFARWQEDFYDVDRRGYKRRRYKKSQIEKDWEAMVKADKKGERDNRAAGKVLAGVCAECGYRWNPEARAKGLVHICGEGLV